MDFAESTRTVLYCMAGIMAVAALVAHRGLQPGVQDEQDEQQVHAGRAGPGGPGSSGG
jgi:hypothetical protein